MKDLYSHICLIIFEITIFLHYFYPTSRFNQLIYGPCNVKTCHLAYADSKALISLRICAGWSWPFLSANRIIGYYRMHKQRSSSRMVLCLWVGWSESSALCACLKALFRLTRPVFPQYIRSNIGCRGKVRANLCEVDKPFHNVWHIR